MNKREFLKTSAMTAATTAISSGLLAGADSEIPRWRKTGQGNYHYSTTSVFQPSTVAETQEVTVR